MLDVYVYENDCSINNTYGDFTYISHGRGTTHGLKQNVRWKHEPEFELSKKTQNYTRIYIKEHFHWLASKKVKLLDEIIPGYGNETWLFVVFNPENVNQKIIQKAYKNFKCKKYDLEMAFGGTFWFGENRNSIRLYTSSPSGSVCLSKFLPMFTLSILFE